MQKKNYYLVDCVKFIMSIQVLILHSNMFFSYSKIVAFGMDFCINRIATPMFFCLAGFFLANKIEDSVAVKKYVLRIIRLYKENSVLTILQKVCIFSQLDCLKKYLLQILLVRRLPGDLEQLVTLVP